MKGRSRREEMQRLLALREREGLTYAEAARRGGVSTGTLAWWSWRLRQEGHQELEKEHRDRFVEVQVVEEAADLDGEIEVLVGAHRVRVKRGFDGPTLLRVLRMLSC